VLRWCTSRFTARISASSRRSTRSCSTGSSGGQSPAKVLFYVEVGDPQKALDEAVALGGTLVSPVMSVPGQVTMAHFADPDGNVIGIVAAEMPPAE
jgi:predicted enzyme related to lactoylglutathione lyase